VTYHIGQFIFTVSIGLTLVLFLLKHFINLLKDFYKIAKQATNLPARVFLPSVTERNDKAWELKDTGRPSWYQELFL
jgi:hypothetical protein